MQTPDILAGLSRKKGKKIVIGFCLETKDWLKNAERKLHQKNLSGIVANFYNRRHIPFGRRKITTAFMGKDKTIKLLKGKSKPQVAKALLAWVENLAKIKFSKMAK